MSTTSANNIAVSHEHGSFFEKHGFLVLLCLTAAVGIYVFMDFLAFKHIYLFRDIGSDSINGIYPKLIHLADYLRTDGIPGWSFLQGMGQNIYPFSLGNPFDLILFLIGRDNLAYGIVYVEFLKIIIAGTFFYLYLRMFSLTTVVAVVGALSYAFSGFMVLGGQWHLFSPEVVYCALLLYSCELLIQRNSWKLFPVTIALIGAFQPFDFYLFGIALTLYVVFRQLLSLHWETKTFLRLFAKLIAYGALGFAISAVFSLSNIAEMLQSPRASGVTPLSSTIMSQSVFELSDANTYVTAIMRLLSNDTIGIGSHYSGVRNYLEGPILYIGLLNVLLAPQFFYFVDRREKVLYSVILAICFIPIIFPFFRYAIWLFQGSYYRIYAFFVALVVLNLGLVALNRIITERRLNVPLLTASLAFIIALFAGFNLPKDITVNIPVARAIVAFMAVYGAIILLFKIPRYNGILRVVLLAVVATELGYLEAITVNTRPVITASETHRKIGYNDYSNDAIAYLNRTDHGFYRIEKDYTSGPTLTNSLNDGQVQRYKGTSSYYSFNQYYYIKFLGETGVVNTNVERETRWAIGLRSHPILRTFASIKYLLCKARCLQDPFVRKTYVPIAKFGDVVVLRNSDNLDLGLAFDSYLTPDEFHKLSKLQKHVALLNAFVVSDGDEGLMHQFRHFDPQETAKYSLADFKQSVKERAEGALLDIDYDNNNIKGEVHLAGNRLIVFSIPYDRDWTAKVDGKDVKPRLVDIGFMGLPVDAGEHEIELHFSPTLPKYGLAISLIALLVYVTLMVNFRKWTARKS